MVAARSAHPKPVSLPIAVANVALPRTFRVVPDTRLLDRGQHDARSRIQALSNPLLLPEEIDWK